MSLKDKIRTRIDVDNLYVYIFLSKVIMSLMCSLFLFFATLKNTHLTIIFGMGMIIFSLLVVAQRAIMWTIKPHLNSYPNNSTGRKFIPKALCLVSILCLFIFAFMKNTHLFVVFGIGTLECLIMTTIIWIRSESQ